MSGWQEVFVGRDRELNTLAGRLERALHGSGSLVLVAGESGSGKTALLREFVRRAAAIHPELLIGSARGNAHGGFGQPLGIVRDLLALLTGDVQSRSAVRDLDSEQADRLWRGSPSIIRCVLEQAPVLIGDLLQAGPLLDRGLAVGLDRQSAERLSRIVHERASCPPLEWARQEQLTAQIVALLKEMPARFPLMLVLDDLQWCDSASAAILFQLAREAPARRLLLLGAYRPSEPIESTGYAASEVNDCLARIRELHRRTGEQQPLFMVLWQYTMFAGLRADYGRAIDAAEEMMALADRSEDPDAAAVASLARGWLVLMVGRTGDAMADLDRVARLTGTPRELAAAWGTEPLAAALAWKSWGHWLRDDPAAARTCSAQAIARARESGHPLTLAFTLGVAGASLHNFLEEPEITLRFADEVESIASRHGLAFYAPAVQLYRGVAHFQQAQHRRALDEIRSGLAGWGAVGTRAYRSYFLSLAALAQDETDHTSEALRIVREAVQHIEETGERIFETEVRRRHALLLAKSGAIRQARAEMRRAIQIARQQGAIVLLRRATSTLSELDTKTCRRVRGVRMKM